MKKIILICLLSLPGSLLFAGDQDLLDENACNQIKEEAVGGALALADYFFKEAERLDKEKPNNKEETEEVFAAALAFSEIAENYSTVYAVWCKD
tara:strand:+ start:60 stop:341 length:282 start_codon:yes stop_codon:yes gene_type:complete